jgi:nucleotide-binding universal stress UspA family protein
MPQVKRILFPVDFSDSCKGAARYLEAFAGQFEAEILMLHAVAMTERTLPEELLPVRQAELDAFLEDELKYFTTQRVCVAGEAESVIAESADFWKPDLVMMATHGLGFFRRHLLGSVVAKALHDLKCPVWTDVHGENAPPLEDIHCRRILCAVDLGDRSRCVLEWAAWLAGEYQAGLGIVHATTPMDAATSGWTSGEEFEQHVAEAAKERISALQAEVGADARVFIDPGNPAGVIAAAATDFAADLLVIGRHDQSGIAGLLLQNAFAILRESPCPVISI